MSAFDRIATDRVSVRKSDGAQLGPYKAVVSSGKITIFDASADVIEGDTVVRVLPNGREDVYRVLEATFSQGLEGIPATWGLQVRKASLPDPPNRNPSITIHSAHAVQIGDANTQNIIGTVQVLAQAIDASNAPEAEKAEAKDRLKAFLEHPLVASILGAAAGGALTALK